MALATTASQTTLTFSADATVEFKTTRVSPEPASPEPGSPLRTPMPGRSKEFFATPQQSRQRDDDLISMSPITPGYGLDPTPRPPSKTRFAAALDATEEAPVATTERESSEAAAEPARLARDALAAQGADGRRRGAGGAAAASLKTLAAAAARGAVALLPAPRLRVPRAARVGLGLELRHDVRRDGAGLDAHARVADAHELDVALPPPRPGDPVEPLR